MSGRQQPPALILAGGASRRMGRDKATAILSGQTMIARIVERLAPQVMSLAINAPQGSFLDLGLPLVPDTIADRPGPLAGVLAGLRHAATTGSATHLLTVPADTPFLPRNLAATLCAAAADPQRIVLAASAGQVHPVVALWPLSLADDLETWLTDPDNRRLQAFIVRHPSLAVDFPLVETPAGPLDPFFNVNTPADLLSAERYLEALPR